MRYHSPASPAPTLLYLRGLFFLPLAPPKHLCSWSSLPFFLIASATLITSAHGSQILLLASIKDPMRAPWPSLPYIKLSAEIPNVVPASTSEPTCLNWTQCLSSHTNSSFLPHSFCCKVSPSLENYWSFFLVSIFVSSKNLIGKLQNLPTVSLPNLFAPSVVWILTYTLASFGSFLFHSFNTCCQIHLFIAQLGSCILLINRYSSTSSPWILSVGGGHGLWVSQIWVTFWLFH